MKRPLIADRNAGALVGIALLAAAVLVLWDAYEGHGRPKPRLLSALVPV